jgi:hypothetical protein
LFVGTYAQTEQDEQVTQGHAWDGSRAVPVHLLPLKDEFDQPIIPTEAYPLPFSTRFTCAPCHAYDAIRNGLHFNAGSSRPPGRPGEPWFWVDEKTGTVLPLSYREWEGVWQPRDLGLSPWEFVLLFGRHMTGGGVGETGSEFPTPESRWEVSGNIEINCLGCHNASRLQSHSEWAKQILRENFRWAGAAASGLGEVGGMASRLPVTWDLFDGPNPDDTEWAVAPSVKYRPHLFDSKHRVFFDFSEKPDSARCLVCHSVSSVGLPKFRQREDVHLAAGMKCVDCHRHDLSHAMIRGYEGEAEERGDPALAAFSCKGCHMGEDLKGRGKGGSGRLGAPYPQHKGIPAVHFERLTCTVCHAGAVPGKDPDRVRTSRANRLGIYGVAQWSMSFPHVSEPVFIKEKSGRISPHRLVWPSFWGRREGENILPLAPSLVADAAADVLNVAEDLASLLIGISVHPEIKGIPVIVVSGKAYSPNIDGKLDCVPFIVPGSQAEFFWALRQEEGITPLIPDFDPAAEEPDMDAEIRVQSLLESLWELEERPGEPVLFYKGKIFHLVEGYMEIGDSPEKAGDTPELLWENEGEFLPLITEFQIRTMVETVGVESTLTEEQVAVVLRRLNAQEGDFVYVASGKVFALDVSGSLTTEDHAAAAPASWPLGHQVRPAQQALGQTGCTQCHSESSAVFFTRIPGTGPLKTERRARPVMTAFMGLDQPYQRLFGLSFRIRPFFKVILAVCVGIVSLVLLLVLLSALGRITGLNEKGKGI